MQSSSDKIRPGTLAEFLRAKRAQLKPEDVNLPRGRRRRTPGLRREELADLAGVGPAWYAAFEQGRDVNPSNQFLHALASALLLNGPETRHLFFLAGRQPPVEPKPSSRAITPGLRRLLDIQNPYPAMIADRRWDWVAWNDAANFFFDVDAHSDTARGSPNSLWETFSGHSTLSAAQWEAKATLFVSMLRATPLAPGDSQWFEETVQSLMAASSDFCRIWDRYEVADVGELPKFVRESVFGPVECDLVTVLLPEMPEAWMMIVLVSQDIAERLAQAIRPAPQET
jgi:transcriptional regulator with XRE-family HTH domain